MKFLALSLLMTLNVFAQAQVKVYVLDGGILEGVNPERFGLKQQEVTTTRLPRTLLSYCGNANIFSGATWLVRRTEYDAMFSHQPPKITWPVAYSSLKKIKGKS